MLQHIKIAKERNVSLYISADHPYFTTHTLYDVAQMFYKNGGKHLYIDEVHKYVGWSHEVKMMHDGLSGMQVTLSGSSMIDLIRGLEVDLSRRAIPYTLEGMSFREYLNFKYRQNIQPCTLNDILAGNYCLPEAIEHPLPYFAQYMEHGYYPFLSSVIL